MVVVDYTAQESSFSTLNIQTRRSTSYTRPIGSRADDLLRTTSAMNILVTETELLFTYLTLM
jgi:hypothetical protein